MLSERVTVFCSKYIAVVLRKCIFHAAADVRSKQCD